MFLPFSGSHQPTILLVDDDIDICHGLKDWLEHCQYQVECVHRGTEAITRARSMTFMAVILDLGLPDMDGMAVLQAIRGADSNLPVIILTAFMGDDLKTRCLSSGAYGVMSKPYHKQALRTMLGSAVAARELSLKTSHAESALRYESYSEQQAQLDLIPGFFWYKDRNNRIIRANANAAASIGRTVQQVEERSTYEFYPEADQYYRDDQEVLTSGQPKLGIVELYQMASGKKRWIKTDKVPYRDETGAVIGVLVFASEISGQTSEEATTSNQQPSREGSPSTDQPLRLVAVGRRIAAAARKAARLGPQIVTVGRSLLISRLPQRVPATPTPCDTLW